MEKLQYIIEDSTIAEVLGVQNFTNPEAAVLELVKNAFDAQARKLDIIFNEDEIIVKDDGIGMNYNDIKKHWMHIGKSNKFYEVLDRENNKRILAGSKGVGRFALSRLGTNIELTSQKDDPIDKSVLWTTNWNHSNLYEGKTLSKSGTRISIKGLRDKWNKAGIEQLRKYLDRTYNNNLMKIRIISRYSEKPQLVLRYFNEPQLALNCTSILEFKYISETASLECVFKSDEFKNEAKKYISDINPLYFKKNIDCAKELKDNKRLSLPKEELVEALKTLGNFSAEFYFSLKEPALKDVEKFLYKHSFLAGRYESGVILYRNSFSIASYDGTKDWLGLGKRTRLSPAAATHPTGSWRIRENQLAGKVEIDKLTNHMLKDLSNRQGFDENIYFKTLLEILDKGLAEYERYRQKIIRGINKKNKFVETEERKIVENVIKKPTIVRQMTNDQLSLFVSEIKDYKNENINIKKEIHSTEERYKYDVRILNVLATSGLKATAIAHEMHNDRNSIAQNYENIVEAMKDYDIWDYINEKEKTKYAFSNIPELLNKNKRINVKLVSFMDTMLEEVEKSNFIAEKHNLYEVLENIKSVWERDYVWVKINLEDVSSSISFVFPEDSLKVIFDNLILNSIQHNEDKNYLEINIKISFVNGMLEIFYNDDGRGLTEKYLEDPMKILEVHETSRKQGHGLGMWIVNNTVTMSGGEILDIDGHNGFFINFTFGGSVNG
ncbi:sensor histidine kinase [Paenibacillus odorifer]|uniref:histidine kinase n=1 Tax=Paenibacillus odorifer TaxID=189426 RepID=A0AAD0KEK3_9BACL|nr:ATP-binding protein [Paenibacillus odorifer]AWV31777.1 hypothetical protein CD191_03565 [Paenibacillus odorifer]